MFNFANITLDNYAISTIVPKLINHPYICNLCGCADLLQTYYGGSSMSLNPDIVPLLSCPQVEVSQLVLGSDVSVEWVCFAQFAGRVEIN